MLRRTSLTTPSSTPASASRWTRISKRFCSPSNSMKSSACGDAGAQMLDVRDAAEYRQRASGRQHQHRPRRPIRHLGGHGPRSRPAHRDYCRAGTRTGSRVAPRPHRLRSRHGLSRWRHGRARRHGRTWCGPRSASPPAWWPRSWRAPIRPCCSISAIPANGTTKHIAGSVNIPAESSSGAHRGSSARPPHRRPLSRAATAPPSPPASCTNTASPI